jgi:hypothetical protein
MNSGQSYGCLSLKTVNYKNEVQTLQIENVNKTR